MADLTPLSPEWWLARLERELISRAPDMTLMNRFYVGDHPLPFLTKAHESKLRDEFRQLLEESRSNFMRLVVDAVEERLRVEGIRLSASGDQQTDRDSWRIWQANQMDAESQTAFVEALVKGVAYLSVWPNQTMGQPPVITVEDPLETIVGYQPGSNYRRRAAALKLWTDDWTGDDRANVYLPNGIYKFRRRSSDTPTGGMSAAGRSFEEPKSPARAASATAVSQWEPLDDEFVPNPQPGVIPIVPLRNRPRLLLEGESELADVHRVQSQINGFLFLLAIAGYFGAHRQRWMVGGEITEKDGDKPAAEPFNVAIDRLWQTDDPNAKFGEFSQTDLGGYIQAIEQKILHIAVTTRTPRHYLIEQGQSPSGDAIKSAESGLTKKVERKQRPFGEGLEEALRLARLYDGKGDTPPDSEIYWADPTIRTEAEITDAAIKKFHARLITWQQACEDIGYTATQIERMLAAFGGTPPDPTTDGAADQPAAA